MLLPILVFLYATWSTANALPIIATTWVFGENATNLAWRELTGGAAALDAIERGISQTCEMTPCSGSVGSFNRIDEEGVNTLDAMMIDGPRHDYGAVGALTNLREAISVAKAVLQRTTSTLVVGDRALRFAKEMGFEEVNTRTESQNITHQLWRANDCQPNTRKNVIPDPRTSCGPYRPGNVTDDHLNQNTAEQPVIDSQGHAKSDLDLAREAAEGNHDTICQIIVDENRDIYAGTSTNGLGYKVPGRVGDTPIPGSGAYVDNDYGASVATGNGDIMMRFVPTYHAVEMLRHGMNVSAASQDAVDRIVRHYPAFSGAVITVDKHGNHAAACNAMRVFSYYVRTPNMTSAELQLHTC